MHSDFQKLNCERAVQLAKDKNVPYVLHEPAELDLFPAEWWLAHLPRYDKKTAFGNWSMYYDASLMPKMANMIRDISGNVCLMAKGKGFIFFIMESKNDNVGD